MVRRGHETMARCPITYEELAEGRSYSLRGLRLLDRRLADLKPLPLSAEEQRQESLRRVGKMSVQGIQLKLSAVLKSKDQQFEIVDRGGRFLLKPQSLDFKELPENEDLTMRLARLVGIDVPLHALIRSKDGSLTYLIKRFDREGRNRVPVEDFAQLSGRTRETKYDSSMEKVAKVIDQFATFPMLEKAELFRRTLFSFLVGNEDMHLKNFSLISDSQKTTLSPAYDLVNSTLAMNGAREELALPVRGKKSNLTRNDLVEYFAGEYLKLSEKLTHQIISEIEKALPSLLALIGISFLSEESKVNYRQILRERAERLQLK
jgi:serine/threonine-protein kinase HipA